MCCVIFFIKNKTLPFFLDSFSISPSFTSLTLCDLVCETNSFPICCCTSKCVCVCVCLCVCLCVCVCLFVKPFLFHNEFQLLCVYSYDCTISALLFLFVFTVETERSLVRSPYLQDKCVWGGESERAVLAPPSLSPLRYSWAGPEPSSCSSGASQWPTDQTVDALHWAAV